MCRCIRVVKCQDVWSPREKGNVSSVFSSTPASRCFNLNGTLSRTIKRHKLNLSTILDSMYLGWSCSTDLCCSCLSRVMSYFADRETENNAQLQTNQPQSRPLASGQNCWTFSSWIYLASSIGKLFGLNGLLEAAVAVAEPFFSILRFVNIDS